MFQSKSVYVQNSSIQEVGKLNGVSHSSQTIPCTPCCNFFSVADFFLNLKNYNKKKLSMSYNRHTARCAAAADRVENKLASLAIGCNQPRNGLDTGHLHRSCIEMSTVSRYGKLAPVSRALIEFLIH